MSRGYDWEASFGGCATGTTDKNDEFRPKNAVFRFKLKEINFEAVQTCIVEEFLFGDFKPHNPAQTKLAWPQYEQLLSIYILAIMPYIYYCLFSLPYYCY